MAVLLARPTTCPEGTPEAVQQVVGRRQTPRTLVLEPRGDPAPVLLAGSCWWPVPECDAHPGDRTTLIRAALNRAADEDDYLDSDYACKAIAAAATLTAQLPGGQPIDSPYAPEFLRGGNRLKVPEDLAALAVRAIDRIMADDSEWRDLWQDATDGDTNAAFDAVHGLRTALSAVREGA